MHIYIYVYVATNAEISPIRHTVVHRGDGSKPQIVQFLVQDIAVRVRNDQMLKVTTLQFQ